MGESPIPLRSWDMLPETEQLELRIQYGHYLDQLPPTCSLADKEVRFSAWLAEHGVHYAVPGNYR